MDVDIFVVLFPYCLKRTAAIAQERHSIGAHSHNLFTKRARPERLTLRRRVFLVNERAASDIQPLLRLTQAQYSSRGNEH